MSDDLTYLNDEGYTVLKSQFHRNRGRCCKSSCLHCPFGVTLSKFGVVIHKDKVTKAKELFSLLYEIDDFTSSLMGNAFGKPKTIEFNPSTFFVLTLKDVACGLIEIEQDTYKSFKLLDAFSDQGITEEYLKSLL